MQYVCKEYYTWSRTIYIESDSICQMDEYLNNCTCIKHAVDNLLVTCENYVVNIAIKLAVLKILICVLLLLAFMFIIVQYKKVLMHHN